VFCSCHLLIRCLFLFLLVMCLQPSLVLWYFVVIIGYCLDLSYNPMIFLCPCHIKNSETYPRYVWLQYNIKFLWLFGFICAQNSVSGLVLYNELNFIKSPQLFGFNWVKINSYLYLFLLPNYLLQILQIYLNFIQSFLLFKSKLLFSVLLLKLTWRSVLITSFIILYI